MKPIIHAKSSAKKFGGHFNDYLEIHQLMDQYTKSAIGDNRHRAMTHNTLFVAIFLPRMIWSNSLYVDGKIVPGIIVNSRGKEISVRDIGEQHLSEDYRNFQPTYQDFLDLMEYKDWMSGINYPESQPPSHKQIFKNRKEKVDSMLAMYKENLS